MHHLHGDHSEAIGVTLTKLVETGNRHYAYRGVYVNMMTWQNL